MVWFLQIGTQTTKGDRLRYAVVSYTRLVLAVMGRVFGREMS